MKIFTEMHDSKGYKDQSIKVLVMFLDTEKTGNKEKDTFNCAIEFKEDLYFKDANTLLNLLIPTLSQLVYTAYGDTLPKTTPLTDWHATGFDKNAARR